MRHRLVSMIVPLMAVVLLSTSLVACGSAEGPPEIEYGRDLCEQCGMIIDDPGLAAAYRDAEGVEHLFDEVGGMLVTADMLGHLDTGEFWVHDYGTEEAVSGPAAFFVHGAEVPTPMDFRIVAFAEAGAAEAFARLNGGIQHSWDQLVAMAKAHEIVPNPDIGDDAHHHGG